MPAQVADWSEVKATAIATGSLKEAAEKHGIEPTAVRMRASREQWPVGRRVHKIAQEAKAAAHAQIVKSSGGTVTSVTSASDALSEVLAEDSKATRTALSKATRKASEHAQTLSGDEILMRGQEVKAIQQVAAGVHGWNDQASNSVRISIFTGQHGDEGPVIDV